jgi:RNA polymerase sigma-70 factor, ECF subfamily
VSPAPAALAALLVRERRRVVALLARSLGLPSLGLAEDAVQTAALRALESWPRDGVPGNPAGWLYRVARHEVIDTLRRDGRLEALPDDESLLPAQAAPTGRFAGELDDDELALVFAACHPSLPPATQVVLALRTLAGLALKAIAPMVFASEASLAQRLARARGTLATGALYFLAGHELPARRESVATTLALMFHLGQRAAGRAGDAQAAREAMAPCWEAIRLARALAAHPATAHGDADALAALLLLHGARLTGSVDEAGDIVPLPGQPRDRWDAGMIRMGFMHLHASQRAAQPSRWHLLAGVAAEHAAAPDHGRTEWAAIVRYYDALLVLDPSAAPRLGHAIALAEAGEPAAAHSRLVALLPDVPPALRAHTLAALARADERLGDIDAAVSWLAQAEALAPHPADARLLARRREALAASLGRPVRS